MIGPIYHPSVPVKNYVWPGDPYTTAYWQCPGDTPEAQRTCPGFSSRATGEHCVHCQDERGVDDLCRNKWIQAQAVKCGKCVKVFSCEDCPVKEVRE